MLRYILIAGLLVGFCYTLTNIKDNVTTLESRVVKIETALQQAQ